MDVEKMLTVARGPLAVSVFGGRGHSKIFEYDGRKYFYKDYSGNGYPPIRGLKGLEFKLFEKVKYDIPSTRQLTPHLSPTERCQKEVSTIQKWADEGIETPKIIAFGDTYIVYNFMVGRGLNEILEGDLNISDFEKMVNVWQRIRAGAIKYKDVEMLHPDPYPDNFFYDEQRKLVLPIDPGKGIVTGMPFDEVDARLNLFMLQKIFGIKTSGENQKRYLQIVAESFSDEDKKKTADICCENTAKQKAALNETAKRYGLGAKGLLIYCDHLDEIREALYK